MIPSPKYLLSTCRLHQKGETFTGEQGLQYAVGISTELVGARGIHMQLVTIPGGSAYAHKHAAHETAIFGLARNSWIWHGEHLEHHSIVKVGDFFYIPADVPHLPYKYEHDRDHRGRDRQNRSRRAGERGSVARVGGYSFEMNPECMRK